MYILSEKELEDVLVIHPELIEEGLTLMERQGQLESGRTDLTFRDKNGHVLLVELKKDMIQLEHIEQILHYVNRLKRMLKKNVRGMLVGQTVPEEAKNVCNQNNIEWKEIKTETVFNYLKEVDKPLLKDIFQKGKLHKKAKAVEKMSFQEYLNETSPFGIPYTSYQFFMPIDASPELSQDSKANQEVADAFFKKIMDLPFHRFLFDEQIEIRRNLESSPIKVSKAKNTWQGYEIPYTLFSQDFPEGLPCEIYIGSIGYRGSKVFADNISRFIQVKVGKGKNHMTTQYGVHKYLRTEKRALFPYYELKFSPKGLPKRLWEDVYQALSSFGYYIQDSSNQKPSKLLWIGEISLEDKQVDQQVGNLIEALFAVTIVKAHFKGEEKGIPFAFLPTLNTEV